LKTSPSKRGIASWLLSIQLVAACALSLLPSAFGQLAPEEPMPVIRDVRVEFTGVANVSPGVVRANMSVREGMEYDELVIDRDIRSLYRTGLFEFIEIKQAPAGPGQIDLIVSVRPKYRVGAIRFEGNSRVGDRRLRREIETRSNAALNERQIKTDSEKIFAFYQKAGYSQARVDFSIDRNLTSGTGDVIFRINEGPKVRVRNIIFEGNTNLSDRRLRREMETRRWHLFSWLTGKGRFRDDTFEDDLEKVRDYYREQGYLDVEISQANVRFTYPSPDRMVITVPVEEGRQYRVGDISFTGNELHPAELLRLILRVRSGDIFAPTKLDDDVERISDFYGRDGYLDTRVRLQRMPNIQTGNIDIVYQVAESERFSVETVRIEGNTKTKSIVILRELTLGPGEVFDSVRMKASRMRLENTRFFDEVNAVPESTNIPGRKNLKVTVREGRTGNLTFGAGFSSLERAVVFVELTQGNFDLFNYRSFFQGDGQKLRIKAQLGQRSNEIILAFEEPWLFEQELAVGFQVYRQRSDYVSVLYDELQYGFEVYTRKRLIELIEGRLSYHWRVTEITGVAPDAPIDIQNISQTTSRVGFNLLRDTRDSLMTTTRGNRGEVITEVVGGVLGGDLDFYRLETRGAQYFPVFEAQRQVVEVLGRLGSVQTYGDTERIPPWERYYLGGPTTLRGFDFREVGPRDRDTGRPLGGKSYGMFSVEYSLDIVQPIRFALFYDAGFVNRGAYDFNPKSYNDNFGFGLRLFIMGAPLRLDYGIPITTDRFNDQGGQFHFSFGTRF
jgi:outer membrane protein insertion porin family